MAATPDGKGYWLVASDGGLHLRRRRLLRLDGRIVNKPIVGMAATPDGKGYWLVASDGGIFTFGDAAFYGSTGVDPEQADRRHGRHPRRQGLLAGGLRRGLFTYGDAPFYGSPAALSPEQNVVAMATTPDGKGYWLVASEGGMTPPPGTRPSR